MADRQETTTSAITPTHGELELDLLRRKGKVRHWLGNLSLGRVMLYLFTAVVILYISAPLFVTVPISFSDYRFLHFPPDRWSLRWYENYFTSRNWINSTIDSFIVAPLVVLFSVPLGALGAYSLVRGRYPGKGIINALAIFPLIVPQLITAVAIFFPLCETGFDRHDCRLRPGTLCTRISFHCCHHDRDVARSRRNAGTRRYELRCGAFQGAVADNLSPGDARNRHIRVFLLPYFVR